MGPQDTVQGPFADVAFPGGAGRPTGHFPPILPIGDCVNRSLIDDRIIETGWNRRVRLGTPGNRKDVMNINVFLVPCGKCQLFAVVRQSAAPLFICSA